MLRRLRTSWSPTTGVVVLSLALWAAPASGHKFHVSIAEAEWNAETQSLEIALRVSLDDLEKALSMQQGPDVALEKTANLDAKISSYLTENFLISNAETGAKALPLQWVGKEIEAKHAWLYFECALPGERQDLWLNNTVFFELDASQVNTVNVKDGDAVHTLTFTKQDRQARLFPTEVD